MPISEITKQVVNDYKSQLKIRWQTLSNERNEHLASAATLKVQMDALKAQADALAADIPEPTPVIMPP